ncbi:MAG: hypothetical protein R2710_22590 [Acidimicrobiales bacterium]
MIRAPGSLIRTTPFGRHRSTEVAHVIGAGSTLLAVLTIFVVAGSIASGRWCRCVAGVFGPLGAGFAYAGMAGHVLTAPVIGANIGAGLVMLGAVPAAGTLISIISISWRACMRTHDSAPA